MRQQDIQYGSLNYAHAIGITSWVATKLFVNYLACFSEVSARRLSHQFEDLAEQCKAFRILLFGAQLYGGSIHHCSYYDY